jgi:putative transposase
MPRQSRLILPDVPIHAVHRGNNRMNCFHEEPDYLVYLALLVQGSRKSGCAVHAYCVMTNHVHVLFTPPTSAACGAFMHGVAQRYAYYYNRRYQRTGTLWEGRFRSCIVASSDYVLACYRYIELNPVRAGIVGDPRTYRWSSSAANCGARDDVLVKAHEVFQALDREGYSRFVDEGIDSRSLDEIRDALNTGYPLASESFKAKIGASTGKKTKPGRPGRPARIEEESGKSVAVPDLFSAGGVS